MLNLHFLVPYLKDSTASLGLYEQIFQLLPLVPPQQVHTLLSYIKSRIVALKRAIIDNPDDVENGAILNEVMPTMHLLLYMLCYS